MSASIASQINNNFLCPNGLIKCLPSNRTLLTRVSLIVLGLYFIFLDNSKVVKYVRLIVLPVSCFKRINVQYIELLIDILHIRYLKSKVFNEKVVFILIGV